MIFPRNRNADRVLVVEGTSEKLVVRELLEQFPAPRAFEIIAKRGCDQVIEAIGVELKAENLKSIGFILDANSDLNARWGQVVEKIHVAGISFPEVPDPRGTVVSTEHSPTVGVWLMPNNSSPGELEDFLAPLIPDLDRIWPLSNRYIIEVVQEDRRFKCEKELKAAFHAWLAVQRRPGWMGDPIKDGLLDTHASSCQAFVQWLHRIAIE